MAKLDRLYYSWKESDSDAAQGDLFAAILAKAKRLTKDDDAAQDAVVHIFKKLHSFTPKESDSFTRWVFSVSRRRRLESYRSRDHEQLDDATYVQDDDTYNDWTRVPEPLRSVALSLHGGVTICELAKSEGITRGSLRRRILKACTF